MFCSETENCEKKKTIKERIGLGKVMFTLNFIKECCQHFVLGYTKNSLRHIAPHRRAVPWRSVRAKTNNFSNCWVWAEHGQSEIRWFTLFTPFLPEEAASDWYGDWLHFTRNWRVGGLRLWESPCCWTIWHYCHGESWRAVLYVFENFTRPSEPPIHKSLQPVQSPLS